MSGAPFSGSNSQDAQQFAISPFQKYTIPLSGPGINRVMGETLPQYQGNNLFVEACDYPCLISFVNATTNETITMTARPGLEIIGPFKGLNLSHPVLGSNNSFDGVPLTLKIVVGTSPGRGVLNQISSPAPQALAGIHTSSSSGVAYSGNIALPPGTRELVALELYFTATTIVYSTSTGQWQLYRGNVASASGNLLASVGYTDGFGNVYDQFGAGAEGFFTITALAGAANAFKASLSNLPIPTYATSLVFTIGGTGITALPGALLKLY